MELSDLACSLKEELLERIERGETFIYSQKSPSPPIHLLLSKETPQVRSFLEKVALVLSERLAPACIAPTYDSDATLFLAPLEEQENFPLSEGETYAVHRLSPLANGSWFLPLEPLDSYLTSPDLKRSLWEALKKLSWPL